MGAIRRARAVFVAKGRVSSKLSEIRDRITGSATTGVELISISAKTIAPPERGQSPSNQFPSP
jgi:hypothetical protein